MREIYSFLLSKLAARSPSIVAKFVMRTATSFSITMCIRDSIVAAALDRLHVFSGLTGNAELIVVPDQPAQPLQTPEEMCIRDRVRCF